MPYAVEDALFQWEEGEQRVREAEASGRGALERALAIVHDELRRRLGSSFAIEELAGLYGSGVDWAWTLAERAYAGAEAAWVVDAAFARYAREAKNFAGGRRHGG